MHGAFLGVGHWLLHLYRVELLLQASLLQVGHEKREIVVAARQRLRLGDLARLLPLDLGTGSRHCILVDRGPHSVENFLVRRVLANGVGGFVGHVASLLDQLVRHDLLQGGRPRGIAFGGAHLVSCLLGIA